MEIDATTIANLPTRPMRVKVLYTFDSEGKTNCLARVPEVLQIPSIAVDEITQIGLVKLEHCLNALTSASPELFSHLSSGDFTIYAHDYSEDGTPLVGQGMLSVALSTYPADADHSWITGRICRNVLSLLGNGPRETLEVKLKLTPVSRTTQTQFLKVPGALHMPNIVTQHSWSTETSQNDGQQVNDTLCLDTVTRNNNKSMELVDDILGIDLQGTQDNERLIAQTPNFADVRSDVNRDNQPAFTVHPRSAPGSRAISPITGLDGHPRNKLARHESFSGFAGNEETRLTHLAPSGVSEVHSPQRAHHRQASAPSPSAQSIYDGQEALYNDENLPRKRAKVTRTDWHGRSSFGSRSSDLRVTASTAASVHMHRPIPKRAVAPGSNLEPPPRVPTPVPDRGMLWAQRNHQSQPQPTRRSLLRQASVANSDMCSDYDSFSEAVMSSPEENSPSHSLGHDDSPQDIPSSPPVFTDLHQIQPSSPRLPALPVSCAVDSGYLSDRGFDSNVVLDSLEHDNITNSDAIGSSTGEVKRPLARAISHESTAKSSNARSSGCRATTPFIGDININLETPGDMNQLPQRMLLNLPPGRRESSVGPKSQPSRRPQGVDRPATSPVPSAEVLFEAGQLRDAFSDVEAQRRVSNSQPSSREGPSSEPVQAQSSADHQSRRGSLALPPNPLSANADLPGSRSVALSRKSDISAGQSLQKYRTASNDSEVGSPAPSDNESRSRGPSRSGSGAQRRKLIEQKLQRSIQNGEMPTFCSHCGAIETPTWRRLYVKRVTGKPSPLDYQEGEGETVGIQTEENEDGEVTNFIIRKAMKKTKDSQPGRGFEELVVCNPCGLWFNKSRTMRPADKWGRKVSSRKSRKLKGLEDELLTDGLEPQSDMTFLDGTYADNTMDEADETRLDQFYSDRQQLTANVAGAEREKHEFPRRSSSQGLSAAPNSQGRVLRSSPGTRDGSEQSPIEIHDLSSKPTRRILFPSPRREGEMKTLEPSLDSFQAETTPTKHAQRLPFSPKMDIGVTNVDSNVFEAFTSCDKENLAPFGDLGLDESLDHLFGSPSMLFKTPQKAQPSRRNEHGGQNGTDNPPQTPMTGSRKRKFLAESASAANNADARGTEFLTSPSGRYFLRSTPSRLERTPIRTPGRSGRQEAELATPWSRQLARMLSDPSGAAFQGSPTRLPAFGTPGRLLEDCDWQGLDDILSSDFAAFSRADDGDMK